MYYLLICVYDLLCIKQLLFSSELLRNLTEDYDDSDEVLDCGKAVNFTYYDDLIGIAQRYNHPIIPEPEVNRKISFYS